MQEPAAVPANGLPTDALATFPLPRTTSLALTILTPEPLPALFR